MPTSPSSPVLEFEDTGTERTRHCYNPGCSETLSYVNGQQITEDFAINLASWLTVTSENITPEGLRVDCKTFCSLQCLGEYITSIILEYKQAEDKQLIKMSN